MKRTASEVLRDLEVRVAQLEESSVGLSHSERRMLVDFVKKAQKVFPIIMAHAIDNRRDFDTFALLGMLLSDINVILKDK